MTRVEHLALSCLWAIVGAGLGLVAGLTAGWRHAAFRPATDAVVADWVGDLRKAAQSN